MSARRYKGVAKEDEEVAVDGGRERLVHRSARATARATARDTTRGGDIKGELHERKSQQESQRERWNTRIQRIHAQHMCGKRAKCTSAVDVKRPKTSSYMMPNS